MIFVKLLMTVALAYNARAALTRSEWQPSTEIDASPSLSTAVHNLAPILPRDELPVGVEGADYNGAMSAWQASAEAFVKGTQTTMPGTPIAGPAPPPATQTAGPAPPPATADPKPPPAIFNPLAGINWKALVNMKAFSEAAAAALATPTRPTTTVVTYTTTTPPPPPATRAKVTLTTWIASPTLAQHSAPNHRDRQDAL